MLTNHYLLLSVIVGGDYNSFLVNVNRWQMVDKLVRRVGLLYNFNINYHYVNRKTHSIYGSDRCVRVVKWLVMVETRLSTEKERWASFYH